MLSRREMLAVSAAAVATPWALAADEGDPTNVFTGDLKPTDVRLGPPRTLNDYIPFVPPKTKEAWEARRTKLREQLLVANGLWPMPEKTPLNAVVHGKIERDGYTIEKVFFASMPGHYVTGNLYRPAAKSDAGQKLPGVLFAHGHWKDGRFHDAGEKAAKASVDAKGEPDLDRGRFFMQALPATLAKLGFVVFQYDMVGYADSTAIVHREGFKDVAAELRLQSQMGLQTWNSVRALDFLTSLPDVDAKRIGMTGASGGGTQTFILAAIDDRIAAAFPAVMVSTGMQGGCVCENCSLLRVGTGNVEIAGLFAPKPLAMSAANDWTKELMTKGYPQLQELYSLYGAKDKVAARAWLEYGHQYNVHAREFMYAWFLKHLQGKDEEVKETAFKPVPVAELSVYDAEHPRPKDELNAAKLRETMTKASDEQIAKLTPKDAAGLKEFQRVVGTALRVMVNSEVPSGDQLALSITMTTSQFPAKWPGGYLGIKGVASRTSRVRDNEHPIDDPKTRDAMTGLQTWYGSGEKVPFFLSWNKADKPKKERATFVWIHPAGKASLYEKDKWNPSAKAVMEAGFGLLAIDPLWIGQAVGPKPFPVDKNYAGFTYGYNRSLLAERVRDILTAVKLASGSDEEPTTVHLVGWGAMGPVAILAKAIAGDAVKKTAADLNGFSFEKIEDANDPMTLPGALKYGGMGTFLGLCAPGEVLVHNHKGTGTGNVSRAAYDAAGAADKLTRSADKLDDVKVIEWLLK
ncbi:Acetyl xylan esterase OS=Rhodopirellula maiorica SM1 GN=RMSM_02599 PE=4 SV=1: AXE1 [Gemmataceae bacterium]|nr:Acetyl xylan esterase OS=Rhodopirellula maiorica SM1 GN=RMSM_02599 PE=4 SV=1: AXE1 [Gemmataceae bacterium]VTU02267.1 Acetyl xylan esterase OS=Rhodopirellula maiorica SM1 GN=RMSM_02599 PE=4 SV=1: AXE1 [Gemmataceae bacterium]